MYCIDSVGQVRWYVQVNPGELARDSFVWLERRDDGQIWAGRFLGNEYVVDTKTGNARHVGWCKWAVTNHSSRTGFTSRLISGVRCPMSISEFVRDRRRIFEWLGHQDSKLEGQGHYFSDWLHEDGGFGVVVVANSHSGELHLKADGTVSFHVEVADSTGTLSVLEDGARQVDSFQEFELIYARFLDQILGLAPDNPCMDSSVKQ